MTDATDDTPAIDFIDQAHIAISAAGSAIVTLIEAVRANDLPNALEQGEAVEQLASALHSTATIALADPDLGSDYRDAIGQLAAAAARFIEGWA